MTEHVVIMFKVAGPEESPEFSTREAAIAFQLDYMLSTGRTAAVVPA